MRNLICRADAVVLFTCHSTFNSDATDVVARTGRNTETAESARVSTARKRGSSLGFWRNSKSKKPLRVLEELHYWQEWDDYSVADIVAQQWEEEERQPKTKEDAIERTWNYLLLQMVQNILFEVWRTRTGPLFAWGAHSSFAIGERERERETAREPRVLRYGLTDTKEKSSRSWVLMTFSSIRSNLLSSFSRDSTFPLAAV